MLMEISVFPIGEGVSLSEHVAKAAKVIQDSGLKSELHAMGSLVEGDADQLFDLAKRCHLAVKSGASRVLTQVKFDDRDGAESPILNKVKAVEKLL